MTCPYPHHKVRSDLPPLTPRIAKLPVDERGYPVPFFVAWLDEKGQPTIPGHGKPEFRAADGQKFKQCLQEHRCWVCGEPMGALKAFVIGPMCTVNRVTAEPPSHLECAEWSVKGCPFLTKPQMVRREGGLEGAESPGGFMIKENPGVMAIWVSRTYKIFFAGTGPLLKLGDPLSMSWWTLGRLATKEEVMTAIDVGLPRLEKICRSPEELAALHKEAQATKVMIEKGFSGEGIQTRG